jgi:hypothetical protein
MPHGADSGVVWQRNQLEHTNGGFKQVATADGFGSVDVMRRAHYENVT